MSGQYMFSSENSTNVLLKVFGYAFWGLWMLAPGALSRLALRLFFKPRSLKQQQEEAQLWQTGTSFSMTLRGRTLRGRYWGEGPGVLMVHGWNGRGSQFHKFVQPIVSRGYRAIVIDGPAHGESDGGYTTYFEFTDMVRHLIRGEAGMPVEKVIAHSFGAGAVINAMHKEGHESDVVLIAPALAFEEFLHESFQKAGFPYGLFRGLIGWLERYYGYDLSRDNPRRLIRQINSPLMLIHDRGDKIVPYEVTEQAVDQRTNLHLHTTQGLGHTRILQNPSAIESALGYLLEGERRVVNL